jgi:GAF domain-containing protein
MEPRKEAYYQSLYELAAVLNSSRAPEALLQSMVEGVARTMGAKGCSVVLLSPDRKVLLHTVAHGLSDWYVRKGPLLAEKSISEALEGKPVAVFDATKDERIQYREEAKKEGIASMLSVPMLLREEIMGVIRVYSAEPYDFTPDDMHFVGAIANIGAIALGNAKLHQAVEKVYEILGQGILEWRAALGHEWILGGSVTPFEK